MKQCKECKEVKPKAEYNQEKNAKDGLRSKCKPCRALEQKAYREANPEKYRKYMKTYQSKNPEYKAEKDRRYREKYPDKIAAHKATYRASKLQRTPPWTTSEWERFALQEAIELRGLRSKATGVPHHLDHVMPLQGDNVSGLHVAANFQVIPARDNMTKGNKYAI